MKNLKLVLLVFAFATVLFSCKKSETAVDPRDEMVGTYSEKTTMITKLTQAVPAIAGATDETDVDNSGAVTLTVTKNPNDSKGLIFKETDTDNTTYTYNVSSVAGASNGATFNIASQTVTLTDGSTGTWQGTYSYDLAGLKFDGGYISATKTLSFGLQGTMKVTINAIKYSVPFTGTITATKK